MQARVGDRITVRSRKVGHPSRAGSIVEVRGRDGGPPFVVRWDSESGEHLIYPGSDALIAPSTPATNQN